MQNGRIQAAGDVTDVLTSENLRKVFGIEATIYFDERISAHGISIIRSTKPDQAESRSD
jgi:ABC-type cobalamin/Fe3+-siderophores transport system ATPase subunit